jgi:hypothetical protein
MSKVSMPWKIAGAAFMLINIGGAIYELQMGSWIHGMAHVAAAVGGYLVWQFIMDRRNQEEPLSELTPESRLDSLQSAVDSIALNVERIGEAQRYQEKLVKDRAAPGKERQPES